MNNQENADGGYAITNINIFKDTPAWELAMAVNKQDTDTIAKIAETNPEILDYQEPKYGATVLLWAIGMEKYKSSEALLKAGADPEIASTVDGETPLFLATGFSWIDYSAKKNPKYVKLLLRYGADPNNNESGRKRKIETSLLMHTVRAGIEKTKALVEAGADINYKTSSGYTVAIQALDAGTNATIEGLEYAHYLIAEKQAKVSEPYYSSIKIYGDEEPSKEFYPVDILRDWVYDLGSKEHKMKMEIVEEFARQGVNYWETEIHPSTLEKIQKLYPDTWQEYIKQY